MARHGSRFYAKLDRRRWQWTRLKAFERDGWRCRECGAAGRLEAHHEPPLREGADPYDLAGIVTMCRTCHVEHHRGDRETPGRADWRAMVRELSG